MRIFALATLIAFFFADLHQASAGPVADILRRAEAEGLHGISAERIKTLVRVPAPPREDIEFSRAWIDSLPVASGNAEWRCMAEALYFEARGETVKGMFAVAEVIRNRVASARFPDTICGVINQGTGQRYRCQFTYTCDGRAETIGEPRAYERVGKIARLSLDGVAPELTSGATHYHTTAVRPRWSRTYTRTARYGVHVFYRHTFRTAKN
jgi:spore germination cell wall hydrolase CwlJ-like protein